MTIKQLREIIKDIPDHVDVFLDTDSHSDFKYSLVESAKIKEIDMKEEPDKETLSTNVVLVISDNL